MLLLQLGNPLRQRFGKYLVIHGCSQRAGMIRPAELGLNDAPSAVQVSH
jgi:hypothetical protein